MSTEIERSVPSAMPSQSSVSSAVSISGCAEFSTAYLPAEQQLLHSPILLGHSKQPAMAPINLAPSAAIQQLLLLPATHLNLPLGLQ
jgi:hypothetical protein